MYKKINIFIVGFFSILTIYTNIGFLLYIPLLFYYLIRNYKNIYFFFISGTISLLISFLLIDVVYIDSIRMYLIPFFILNIIIMICLWIMNKIQKSYFIYFFVLLLYVAMQFIFFKKINNYLNFSICLGISMLLYLFLEKNLIDSITPNNSLYNNSYVNILISIIAIIGAANFKIGGINLAIPLGIYYSMYFGVNFKNVYATLYGLISSFILMFFYKESDGLLILVIGSFYLLKFAYPILLTSIFCTTMIFLETNYNSNLLLGIMILSIVFELIKHFLVKEKLSDELVVNNLYSKVTSNVSNEVLSFASFLDKFVYSFKETNNFNEIINESVKTMINNCCLKCPNIKECRSFYRSNLYFFFKHMLEDKEVNKEEYIYFKKNCIKYRELKELALKLNKRYNLQNIPVHNSSLIVQLIGVSNSLRKYAIDMVSKKELDAETIFRLKKDITNFGYDITYLEIIKPYEDDFVIEIGLLKEEISEVVKNITKLSDNIFSHKTSVIFLKNEQDVSYYKIIPLVKINIQYGFGSLSAQNNDICGDNYLIKETTSGKFITAISDGMGNGYNAFKTSNETLNLVSEILEQNLDVQTALEIINTFYAIQEYLDRYATLDLLEIDRHTQIANFYKMGASTSYIIKKGGSIIKIINQNLPFGIEDYVENKDYIVEDGDLILMSSDGIFENVVESESLDEYIKKIRGEAPQKIVYEVLQYILNNEIKINDDATLIALKIKTA